LDHLELEQSLKKLVCVEMFLLYSLKQSVNTGVLTTPICVSEHPL